MRAVRVVPPLGRPDSLARSSPKSDAKGQEQCMRVSVQGGSSKEVSSADYHLHSEAPPSPRRSSDAALVLGTTGPLLLAIAGSAIVPLPRDVARSPPSKRLPSAPHSSRTSRGSPAPPQAWLGLGSGLGSGSGLALRFRAARGRVGVRVRRPGLGPGPVTPHVGAGP